MFVYQAALLTFQQSYDDIENSLSEQGRRLFHAEGLFLRRKFMKGNTVYMSYH